jgi:hypothetical protein
VSDPGGQDHRPVVDETVGPVGSGAMEATPTTDVPIPHHDPDSLLQALEDEPTEVSQISLGQRLRQPRTILSIVVPLGIIALFL